jgi:dolichol-phosphate mannosyltransferase
MMTDRGVSPVADKQALVIVPTYNERQSIGDVIDRLFAATGDTVDLLVVDDGSPDGTGALVAARAEEDPRIHLMQRTEKSGLGRAYVAGFQWGLERGYPVLVEMDADLSHDPADVPRLIAALAGAELAIGSRYVPGGGVRNWSAFRRALSKFGNIYAGSWLRFGVKDSTSGFRAFRSSALASQDLSTVHSQGYGFQIEMVRRLARSGGRIIEVPIIFVERETGASKMSRRIVIEALVVVTGAGLKDLVKRLRRR